MLDASPDFRKRQPRSQGVLPENREGQSDMLGVSPDFRKRHPETQEFLPDFGNHDPRTDLCLSKKGKGLTKSAKGDYRVRKSVE